MKVEAIKSNDSRHSCFVPMAQGAIAGAVVGSVAKYHPLTPQEKESPEYVKVISKINDKINEQKTIYGSHTEKYLDGIKSKSKTTLAEDAFVRMFDGMKEGEHVKRSKIRDALKSLGSQNSGEVEEFKRICRDSTEVAPQKLAKQCIAAYNLVTKHIRPTSFYVITGAVVGAVIAVLRDILKTDIKQ